MSTPDDIESRYYAAQGFDPSHAADVRSHYLPFVEGRSMLVELGAGRGEFLDVAAPVVDRVVGVDADTDMVRQIRDRGHEAVHSDVLAYARDTDDRPDAIFLAHLIEHLSVDSALGLLTDCARILAPGGRLIVVTPNPACLAILRNDFWSDPTHVRLYTLDLLRFLVGQAGFEVVEAAGNPRDVPGAPPLLAAPPFGQWESESVTIDPRADIAYDTELRLEGVIDELARLRAGLESMIHAFGVHQQRTAELHRLAALAAQRHDDTLADLWGPNEIYVVAELRP
jgi:SAM-dependent methyltransferase